MEVLGLVSGSGRASQHGGRQGDDLRRDGHEAFERTVMEWPSAGMGMSLGVLPVVMGLFGWRWEEGSAESAFCESGGERRGEGVRLLPSTHSTEQRGAHSSRREGACSYRLTYTTTPPPQARTHALTPPPWSNTQGKYTRDYNAPYSGCMPCRFIDRYRHRCTEARLAPAGPAGVCLWCAHSSPTSQVTSAPAAGACASRVPPLPLRCCNLIQESPTFARTPLRARRWRVLSARAGRRTRELACLSS